MCGIVGYTGPKNPKDVLISGLKTLEYRGYDSAGIAILDQGEFRRIRAEGKLINLENKLSDQKFSGHLGIGHTRWATHGVPNETNAHPHAVDGVCIVHNGIIENYADLKEELKKKGTVFSSDTDSELVAHLIADKIRQGRSLFDSVMDVLPRLEGAYSILAVSKDHPDEMVAFKNGPPLVLGRGKGEVIIASDIQAIVAHTKEVIHLEDFEIAHIQNQQFQIFTRGGSPIHRSPITVSWSPELVEKQGYRHYMLKEIYEQPRAVAAALAPHIDLQNFTVRLKGVGFSPNSEEEETLEWLANINRVFIVACGTSYYAGMTAKYVIERLAEVPVEVDVASEFRYRNPVIPKGSLVVVISQSGETADTLAALRLVKDKGIPTLSICNVKGSTIDRESHGHLYMNAGVEIGVASTKAFVCSLTVLNLFGISLAKAHKKLNLEDESELVQALLASPSQMDTVLAYDKFFSEAAKTLSRYRGFLYMGRGVSYPIAMEGALKLKELAYMHAEGYAAGEMKHGPLALIDRTMAIVMLAPSDDLYEKTVSNLEEAKARGGEILSIGSGENERLKELSLHYLALPKASWLVNPLLEVLPLQLLAYHIADSLGYDVDQP
ncbi:MAG: glutamine--fructose-6-phosphate transaminase (isomerizing), partial [Bdellovibrionales bacterium]|nr:glutamine--fructose-6-phosphate transaminase (isomerizing) [Bdellovibrionales bacterium]